MPRLYIVPDDDARTRLPPAATRSRRSSASRPGCCERLDEEELEGVLAHEMSHIRNYDVRLMTWAAVLAGSIALLANILLRALWFGGGDRDSGGGNPFVLIAWSLGADPRAGRGGRDPDRDQPPAGVRRRRVRRRADALPAGPRIGAAHDLGEREAVGRALEPVDRAPDDRAAARRRAAAASKLFSTHPPTEDRIARLEEMAGGDVHRHEQLTEGARCRARSRSRPGGLGAAECGPPSAARGARRRRRPPRPARPRSRCRRAAGRPAHP